MAVIERAFDYFKPRGQVLQFGVATNPARISQRPCVVFRQDWTIIGSFALYYAFEQAIAWLTDRFVDVTSIASHTLRLDEFVFGFESFMAGKTLQVHLQPSSFPVR